jgi:predicted nucleotidyltransferase
MGGIYRRDVQRLPPKMTLLPQFMKSAATNLRLTPRERDGIRAAVHKACGETGAVWRRVVLFGSRTDPNRRGGDIDLLVELEPARPADTFLLNQRRRLALEDELGEQRIDLILDDGNVDCAFPTLARETGVELWSNT